MGGDGNDEFVFGDGSGSDTIDGGTGDDLMNYETSTAALTVTMDGVTDNKGTTSGGSTDTFQNVEYIKGSAGNDTFIGGPFPDLFKGMAGNDSIVGNDGDDILEGGAGADILKGGNGDNIVSYKDSDAAVKVTINAVSGNTGGHAQDDQISNFLYLLGSSHDDTLIGDNDENIIEGGPGGDSLVGGGLSDGGYDWLSYIADTTGVNVNLSTSSASGGHAGDDIFSGFQALIGGSGVDTLIGDNNENAIEGGPGGDSLVGGDGPDWLSYYRDTTGVYVNLSTSTASGGHAQDDTFSGFENLFGGSGNDTLIGDDNNNEIEGGPGGDSLVGGGGVDWLSYDSDDTGAGVYVNLATGTGTGGHAQGDTFSGFENIWGSDANDTLIGDTLNNLIRGEGGNDSLLGGNGNDEFLLSGGSGSDIIDGGSGDDLMNYGIDASALTVTMNGSTDNKGSITYGGNTDTFQNVEYIYGSSGNDTFIGGPFQDQFSGMAGDDSIVGNDGNDMLLGGNGADTLHGGVGADTLEGGDGGDNLYGGTDSNWLSYQSDTAGVNIVWSSSATGGHAAGDNITWATFEYLMGGSGPDTLVGDSANNTILGSGGDDSIKGGLGSDNLDGGPGVDWLNYSGSTPAVEVNLGTNSAAYGDAAGDTIAGFENIQGSDYGDTLTGSDGPNQFNGGWGDDVMVGGDGNDTIEGHGNADSIDGGVGNDWLSYASDTSAGVYVDLSSPNPSGGHAAGDTQTNFENIIGGLGADTLAGTDDPNSIMGGLGTDSLFGLGGNDILNGGDGNDTHEGHEGSDTLMGGAGNDIFFYGETGHGGDTVQDFSHANDAFKFSDSNFNTSYNFRTISGYNGYAGQDEGAEFIYDQANDKLWYDSDGSGEGAGVEIANFTNNPDDLDGSNISVS